MLEYDNSAFYYFALSMLALYLVPGTWYAVAEFVRAMTGAGASTAKPRSEEEREKIKKLDKSTRGWARLNTTAYKVNLGCLLVSWILFLYLLSLVSQHGEVTAFDPYHILGIDRGATIAQIKKAYRSLSLKYHPDKNIGNKMAEEMFVRITKAYAALTDEASRENYEKYGNPDGKQALEVSIGLPKLLLENPRVVLVVYLVAMVIVIPGAVAWWYYESKEFGEKNIKHETYNTFHEILKGRPLEELPHHICWSMEFREINTPRPSDKGSLDVLFNELRSQKLVVSRLKENQKALGVELTDRESRKILRGHVLLLAHLLRLEERLTEEQKKDLLCMLTKTPVLMEAIVDMAFLEQWHRQAVTLLHLNRSILQAVWPPQNEFHQLPKITAATSQALAQQLMTSHKASVASTGSVFATFLRLEALEKQSALLSAGVNASEVVEVVQASEAFPLVKIETKLFVEEDEGDSGAAPVEGALSGSAILENDLVTLRIVLTRENVSEGKQAAPVYAPHFPTTMYEGWWLMLVDSLPAEMLSRGREPAVHAFEKVTDQQRVVKHELRFMAPPQKGSYAMELRVISDSYLGLDQRVKLTFEVLEASKLPEYKPHPEDLALDSEPTLFEQIMMASNADEDSSDEEDEEDENEDGADSGKEDKKKKPQQQQPTAVEAKAGGKKKGAASSSAAKDSGKKKAVVVEDVDSD